MNDHATNFRLLLAEDEPDLRNFYAEFLQNQGYKVDLAENGQQALSKLLVTPYDLVLLDIMMPQMSGLEVLKQLGSAATQPESIIVLTNVNDDVMIGECVALGIHGYIIKSDITPDTFLARVRAVLQEKQNKDTP